MASYAPPDRNTLNPEALFKLVKTELAELLSLGPDEHLLQVTFLEMWMGV